MSTIKTQRVQPSPAHRFTIAEYRAMPSAGLLREDDRVELLNGVIVDMTPIGHRHAFVVTQLMTLAVETFRDRAVVWQQLPIQMGEDSEPEPDLSLLKAPKSPYSQRIPVASDALLVVEVSDTTLTQDRKVKAPIYARNGIADYWIINLENNTVEVHRDPEGDTYKTVTTLTKDDRVAPRAFPDDELNIADFLA